MRLFVAFDLDEAVRSRVAGVLESLKESEFGRRAVRWVRPESLHLTLKFIGERPEEELPEMIEALAEVPVPLPTEVRFRGIGCFPNERRPRIIWLGAEAPATLSLLAHSVEGALEPFGVPAEKRAYSPHLTLGRIKEGGWSPKLAPSLREVLESLGNEDFGRTAAREFFLYRSRVSSGGSVYERLRSFRLGLPEEM